ncbi:MAG: restriction endonuclease subunit S [Gemmatimonadota bacterium]|nr:restriction endonuclease subunit S [Gemmatimonadota bacterium]
MNAERLLALYDRVADAPDAVGSLRRFVLDLAVRGKLVEQDPADEPASELLHRIAAERERLVEERVIRRPKPIEVLDEPPFAIPTSWKWTRLGELAELVRGVSFPASAKSSEPAEGLLPCLRSGNIQSSTEWDDLIYVPESVVKNADKLVKSGDVLISIANSYALVGKCSIVSVVPYRATFGAFLAAIRFRFVLPEYAKSFLKSGFSSSAFRVGSSQTTNIANITFSTIRGHPFPLPPLAEQRRIVAKVDELMALCDRLGHARVAREDTRDRLTQASLSRLSAPDADEATFRGQARFAVEALRALTARIDQVKHLRQAILSLAVRGKLVEQDPADEPALELLKRIAGVRAQLGVKRGGKPPSANETPFRLPAGWHWSRLDALCTKTGSGSTPRGGKSVYKKAGIPFLRSQNVYDDGLRLADVAFVGADVHARMAGTAVAARDLLLNITGGSMGRCCRVPDGFAEANVSQHVAIIRPAVPEMADYLHKLVLSPYFQAFIFHKQTGAGRGGLPKNKMDRIAVAVPPLPEQHRIVGKVDELMALCDRLEEARVVREGTRDRLLDSLLDEALLADDATAERPTQFNWLPGGRHD